jgi:glycosyltransferase involved in cell wall biosynthesis
MVNLISIVIPFFNRSRLLLRTLDSVINQTHNNWECILIDDGSNLEEVVLIKSFINKDNRFSLFQRPKNINKGMCGSRNVGIEKAIGDFIMFLDSDDLLKPFCLEQRISHFLKYKNLDFLIFQTELFNDKEGDLRKIPNILNKDKSDISRFISFDYPWNVIAPIYKLNLLKRYNIKWNESINMHEDIEFHLNILTFNLNYKKIDSTPDVYIRMGNDNKVSNDFKNIKSLVSNVKLLENIKFYLERGSLYDKEMRQRLYGLSLFYGKLIAASKVSNLLKEIARINRIPSKIYFLDLRYIQLLNHERSLRLTAIFMKLYKISGVNKRIKYAQMQDSTLAKYSVEEEQYSNLKVVHLSTQESGGAGIAASRIHKGLRKAFVPSVFLTLKKTTIRDKNVVNFKNEQPSFFKKIQNKFFSTSVIQKHQKKLKNLKGQHEGFSFPTSDYKLHEHPLVIEADIIHLHWVSGFLDFPSFFKHVKKPIVWTLHDMNPFQGGFHYKEDEIRNDTVYGKLDMHIKGLKKKAYRNSGLHSIVSPSKWMLEASKKSELLSVFPHIQIANGIDSEVFNILDKKSVRDSLGLPLDKTIFLFVSESLDNKRKQFDVLLDAFSQIKRTDFTLVAVGVIPSDRKSNIHYIGTVKDETKMVELYNAADAFILPSAEDNLPNVMLESLMCGTPVIATPVGGMNEVIEHGVNGYLASEDNAIALKKVLDHFLDTQHIFDPEAIRKLAIEKFELKQQAEAYKNLYTSIVSEEN